MGFGCWSIEVVLGIRDTEFDCSAEEVKTSSLGPAPDGLDHKL
jgi:hypothetical protein